MRIVPDIRQTLINWPVKVQDIHTPIVSFLFAAPLVFRSCLAIIQVPPGTMDITMDANMWVTRNYPGPNSLKLMDTLRRESARYSTWDFRVILYKDRMVPMTVYPGRSVTIVPELNGSQRAKQN